MKRVGFLYRIIPTAMLLLGLGQLQAVTNTTSGCDDCSCKATSKSTFIPRGFYDKTSPVRVTLTRDRMEAREDGWGGTIDVAVFGGKSRKGDRLAQYFFPGCKTKLEVDETQTSTTDIIAENFNIRTVQGNFSSTITIHPEQSFVGAGITWKQELWQRSEDLSVWGSLSIPIVHQKHRMNLKENVTSDGGGANPAYEQFNVVGTMIDAFKQDAFMCGKIDDCCKLEKTRVADVELLLGLDVIKKEHTMLEFFAGINIPTGNRENPEFVFAPVIGNARHFGVLWGNSAGVQLWQHETEDKVLWGYLDWSSQYTFKHCEKRLLDVKYKPWSRYMAVYVDQAQAQQAFNACQNGPAATGLVLNTPGVNIFCQNVEVRPRFSFTFNSALAYRCNKWEGELGYNFFVRKAECLKLKCGFAETSAFKARLGCGSTDNVITIGNYFNDDNTLLFTTANYTENIIMADDLDLQSASQPSMFMHTIYGSLGYRNDDREYPLYAGLGGSFEFSSDNTGMDRWTLWAKGGISF